MKEIWIVNGSGGKGKDKFIELCSKYRRVLNVSSIDPSKNAAIHLVGYNWGDEKDNELTRELLSNLKALSIKFNNYPFKYVSDRIFEFYNTLLDEIMFIHIREPLEIQQVLDKFPNIRTLLITSTRVDDITSNSSDRDVYNFKYDLVIPNDGDIELLGKYAEVFCSNL